MKLIRLTLHNFKGIKDFTLDVQGGNASVCGDNATGKTTLYDAFLWLLFGKDSANRADFEIKTLDASGQPLHNLNHEVEAVLEHGGKTLTLRKVYSEKYTKKRGQATPEFTGHTTDYFLNGVPVQKKEYEARITGIVDEGIFKLLTSPAYFNECMHWQARRNLLLEICGDISDQDVIASDKALAPLPGILGSYSMDEYRKIIQARRSKINDELKQIPVRIDEAERSLADITDIEADTLPQRINNYKNVIQAKQQELARIQSGGEIAERTKQLREIEIEMLNILRQDRAGIDVQMQERQKVLTDAQGRISRLQTDIHGNEYSVSRSQAQVAEMEATMNHLRQEWAAINAEQFTFEQSMTCPTCGQPLPEEKLQEARDKALAAFNLGKAQRLEKNVAQGKALKAEVVRLNGEISTLQQQIDEDKRSLAAEEAAAEGIRTEIDELSRQSLERTGGAAYDAKQREKAALEQEIARLQASSAEAVARVRQEITDLDATLQGLLNNQVAIDRNQATEKRIEELKEQERLLAAEFERLEGELYLCDQFVRTKVNMLEERINSRFKLARFKLFNVLINQGIEETCITTFNGVSYPDLNHGAKLNVGLDIISTLIEHYGFDAPVFVDNAEAVTKLLPIPAQVIRLVVSETDKVLRVEIENPKLERKAS